MLTGLTGYLDSFTTHLENPAHRRDRREMLPVWQPLEDRPRPVRSWGILLNRISDTLAQDESSWLPL